MALTTWFDGDTIKNETSEDLRSKLDHLLLHQGVTASQYINKFLTWNNELSQIKGEAFSRAHSVYLFLKNIVDNEYNGTVTYLRNVDANLDICVASVRKKEREIIQRRLAKRNIRNISRRFREDETKKKRRYEASSSDEEDGYKRSSRTRRAKENSLEIVPHPSGLLSVENDAWQDMEMEKKSFIQEYNARVKHNGNYKELEVPNGMILKNRPRRSYMSRGALENTDKKSDEIQGEEDKTDNQDKRKRENKKRITFPLTLEETI